MSRNEREREMDRYKRKWTNNRVVMLNIGCAI